MMSGQGDGTQSDMEADEGHKAQKRLRIEEQELALATDSAMGRESDDVDSKLERSMVRLFRSV